MKIRKLVESVRRKTEPVGRAARERVGPLARDAARRLRLDAVARWYGEHRAARQWTVNIVGALLLIKFGQMASTWIQPTLTPDMLFTSPTIGPEAVRVTEAQAGEVRRVATYTGQVEPWEENVVYARVDGYLAALYVYPGDYVRRGQLLARLETSKLQPQLEEAVVDSAFWAAEFRRDSVLYEGNAISSTQYDQTRTRYEAASAKVRLMRTQVGYAEIRALNEGWISERRAYPGQYIRAGEPILKIDQLDSVRIQFNVAEEHLSTIRPGTEVYLRFPQMNERLVMESWPASQARPVGEARRPSEPAPVPATEARAGGAYAGAARGDGSVPGSAPEPPPSGNRVADQVPAVPARVAVVFPAEDRRTRVGTVEVRLDNPRHVLKTNTYMVGDFVVEEGARGVRVPVSALTPMPGGKTVVFVLPPLMTEGAVEEREVVVGVRNSRWAEILSGLEPGERVVYQGNRGLVDGQPVVVLSP